VPAEAIDMRKRPLGRQSGYAADANPSTNIFGRRLNKAAGSSAVRQQGRPLGSDTLSITKKVACARFFSEFR
jgi:hypothetical protein